MVALSRGDGTIEIYDVARARDYQPPSAFFRQHAGQITAMCSDKSGRWLATASEDKTVRIWDLWGDDLRVLGAGALLPIHLELARIRF